MGQTQYHRRNRRASNRRVELPLVDELQSFGVEEACVVASIREQARLFGLDRVRGL
ncbi:hypothetical protein I6F34_01370 [Bradyrhizobium sp. BRP05]|nr:hypothetical protein [Bradyrhizobium sp. BRP05]